MRTCTSALTHLQLQSHSHIRILTCSVLLNYQYAHPISHIKSPAITGLDASHLNLFSYSAFWGSVSLRHFPFPLLPYIWNECRFPSASAEVVDLVEALLVFQPNKRLATDQALEHKFMEGASENFPIVTPPVPSNMECDFEGKRLDTCMGAFSSCMDTEVLVLIEKTGQKLTKQEIVEMIKREVQIVREQSKTDASKRLRLKRSQSAKAKTTKVAHESARKGVARAKTVSDISALQNDSAQRIAQLKEAGMQQKRVVKQENARPKRIEQRQESSSVQSDKKVPSPGSSHPPRQQEQLAQRGKEAEKINKTAGLQQKQLIQPTEKVPFNKGRTQSDGNMLHEINRRSRLRQTPRAESNTETKPNENPPAPVASRPEVPAASNKGKSLVDRKRDLIRRTRSFSDSMFKPPSPIRATRERAVVDTDSSPSKPNVRILSPMARKLNEMQNNFREGKISEEVWARGSRCLYRVDHFGV